MTLSPKQQRFCEEYVLDLNASAAYVRAGYQAKNENTIAAAASRLLINVKVAAYIAQLQADRAARTGISADLVVQELAKIAFFDDGAMRVNAHNKVAALTKLGEHLGLFSDFNQAIACLKTYGIPLKQTEAGWEVVKPDAPIAPPLKTRTQAAIAPPPIVDRRDCLLWDPVHGFQPNPGAQATLFTDYVSLECDRLNPSSHRFLWYRGGLNSGKSFAAAAFACANAKRDPQARGLISANSFGQLRTSTLVAIAEFCKKYRIPLSPSADLSLDAPDWADATAERIALKRFCTIFGAPVLVLSAEAFTGRTARSTEVGRGLQIRWFVGDEWAFASRSAFNTVSGRLNRGPGTMPGIGLITSSINKNDVYNWCYDFFDSPDRSDEQRQQFQSIAGSTRENRHADPDYFAVMAASLTPELIAIELEGEYASITEGRIFKYFVRSRHLGEFHYNPELPLHLSIDFNISPSCAIVGQFDGDRLTVLREWYLRDAGTFALGDAIGAWCSTLNPQHPIQLHGDATGNQRTANSRQTNWQIITTALSDFGLPYQTRYGRANPEVQDTINAVNVALQHDRVTIDSHCKELVKDLESLHYDAKGRIDKTDIARSHLGDTLRYLISDLLPLAKRLPQMAPIGPVSFATG